MHTSPTTTPNLTIDPTENEVIHDFTPFFHVYKNWLIKRLAGTPFTPPSSDPTTNIISKDVIISHDPKVSARLYVPVSAAKNLPLIIYIHGGAFTIESAFSTLYHTHLNSLTIAADAISISIEYRLAPEHVVPACYDDCWEALKWVEEQSDTWIKDHADLNRVFLVGDSAGANIAHNLAVRAGLDRVNLNIVGMVLVHPYFQFKEPGKLWGYICPGSSGVTDPRVNPGAESSLLENIVCGKVLVCVAGDDWLKDRGVMYYELLKTSSWSGNVEIVETEGEDHIFHLFKPGCEEAKKFVTLLGSFIKQHDK